MKKKLYKSKSDSILGGVCGGVAEYLEVDSTVIRLIWLLVFLLGGAGLLLYIIAWIIMPTEPEEPSDIKEETAYDAAPEKKEKEKETGYGYWSEGGRNLGIILIILGGVILFRQLAPFQVPWSYVGPLLLVLGGLYLIISSRKN